MTTIYCNTSISDAALITIARESAKDGGAGDLGAALVLIELYRGWIKYDFSIGKGKWYAFQRDLWWSSVEDAAIVPVAMDKLSSIYLQAVDQVKTEVEALEIVIAQNPVGKNGQPTPTDKQDLTMKALLVEQKRLQDEVLKMKKLRHIKDILEVSASLDGMSVTSKNSDGSDGFSPWDCDPWLVGVQNGIVDLRLDAQERFRPGRPEDMVTRVMPVAWRDNIDPTALNENNTEFIKLMKSYFAEDADEIYQFLMRVLGYYTSGIVTEKFWLLLWGAHGDNGKSTIMELMGRIWGPYSSAANKALLIKRNSDSDINTSMADLRGQRVVWVSETSTSDKFDAGAVKYLTGMDTISARRPHEGFRRFEPTHHVIMSTNHKPGADSTDNAFWSRMTMVPFRLSFVENPKPNTHERLVDKKAKDRILKNERDAIFRLLVEGCLDWQRCGGLDVPDCLKIATQAYREEENWITRWIEDRCVKPKAGQVALKMRAKPAYRDFRIWREDAEGRKSAETNKHFMEALIAAGYPSRRDSSGHYYEGIDLYDSNTYAIEDDLMLMTYAIEQAQQKDRIKAMELVDRIIDASARDAARIAVEAILRPLITPAAVAIPMPAGCPDEDPELWTNAPDAAETIQSLQERRNGTH